MKMFEFRALAVKKPCLYNIRNIISDYDREFFSKRGG